MQPKRVLIGGGARSGKSAFALDLATRLGVRRVFLATAEAGDEEMATRIARHAKDRGTDFRTVEVPLEVVGAVRSIGDADVVVIDCLTFWLANQLLRRRGQDEIQQEVMRLVATLREVSFHSIVVTNEVGMGVVPDSPIGRAFRDLSGRAHQTLARAADEVYFGALGMMIRLRPDPMVTITLEDKR